MLFQRLRKALSEIGKYLKVYGTEGNVVIWQPVLPFYLFLVAILSIVRFPSEVFVN